MSKESSSSGIGVLGLLGVAFVVLKLTKVIDWSWWYVTMPFWIGIVLALIMLVVYVIYLILERKNSKSIKDLAKQNPTSNEPVKSRFQQKLAEVMKESENRKLS